MSPHGGCEGVTGDETGLREAARLIKEQVVEEYDLLYMMRNQNQ